jgi:hypothetical protein
MSPISACIDPGRNLDPLQRNAIGPDRNRGPWWARPYLSELLIEVKLLLRVVPRVLTIVIMASAIPAAIRPYSIAVAPDSSDKNLDKRFN